MIISQIVAVATNGVIGSGQKMPWHIPSDLMRFKRLTMNRYVIMGRKTFDSLPKKLEGRKIIILSNQQIDHPDYPVVKSLTEAFALADGEKEIFIAGGGMLYRESMPYTDRIYMTQVDLSPPGDITYPLEALVDFNQQDDSSEVSDSKVSSSNVNNINLYDDNVNKPQFDLSADITFRYKLYTRKKKRV